MEPAVVRDSVARDERVESVARITKSEFERRYVETGRPVVLNGLGAAWPALERWQPDRLKSEIGAKDVPVEYYRDGNVYALWPNVRTMALSRYFDILEAAPESSSVEKYYLAEVEIRTRFPELLPDVTQPDLIAHPLSRFPIFIGRDSISQLHYHLSEQAMLCQIYGRKCVILYAPEDFQHVYPRPWYSRFVNSSSADFDHLSAYPKFRKAKALVCVLEPGDALFIPIHWWHFVYGMDFSISATYFWKAQWRHWIFPRPGFHAVGGAIMRKMQQSPLVQPVYRRLYRLLESQR